MAARWKVHNDLFKSSVCGIKEHHSKVESRQKKEHWNEKGGILEWKNKGMALQHH
ncbi:uncharacterized protein G2W53_040338 [Senna tora]|uniref:Uncharacterized protein n=1 Tax=Senna tora TaxID=362788 RepID=A0A834SI33_9FABA|nr:uncharacterized protein G2W53_040338 [Senna tora]